MRTLVSRRGLPIFVRTEKAFSSTSSQHTQQRQISDVVDVVDDDKDVIYSLRISCLPSPLGEYGEVKSRRESPLEDRYLVTVDR